MLLMKTAYGSKSFIKDKEEDFLGQWKIAALSHDHGYVFEVEGVERNAAVMNKVLPVFNTLVGFPLSSISDDVRNGPFCETGQPTWG